MSDQQNKSDRTLSEISHLFLSSVRERQTGGTTRPVRRPPQRVEPPINVSVAGPVDLTAEEIAQVVPEEPIAPSSDQAAAVISAVIAPHLNEQLSDRAMHYAAHLCAEHRRVGVIEIDSNRASVAVVERSADASPAPAVEAHSGSLDPRNFAEAIEELSWDITRWVVVFPSPRSADSRALLKELDQWTLLATCDHDGVVSCYRTIKGLHDLATPLTTLSLALLDAESDAHAVGVHRKLAAVSQQFLQLPIAFEGSIKLPSGTASHGVVSGTCATDKSHWRIVSSFLSRAASRNVRTEPRRAEESSIHIDNPSVSDVSESDFVPINDSSTERFMQITPSIEASDRTSDDDVIELPSPNASSGEIVAAILKSKSGEWVECPVKPPMCPDATLVVGRDHRLMLLAVAKDGLSDLRNIGRAYQWLNENRSLIAMALPQIAIYPQQPAALQLLVSQADMSADLLQPLLRSESVRVVVYRTLRWAGRSGMLLQAA